MRSAMSASSARADARAHCSGLRGQPGRGRAADEEQAGLGLVIWSAHGGNEGGRGSWVVGLERVGGVAQRLDSPWRCRSRPADPGPTGPGGGERRGDGADI